MQINFFTLIAVLYASAQANAQLEGWFCTCVTNGVVALKTMADCCSSVSGNIHGSDCSLVGGTDASQGVTGAFLQCCLDSGSGAGCSH
ncbi:hypothetical protein DFH09DRAFT_1339669 [Mycena vulgaris]|nr:hypothetical protein DFH09DRAFT_1339669 [Mycena vulgaris]